MRACIVHIGLKYCFREIDSLNIAGWILFYATIHVYTVFFLLIFKLEHSNASNINFVRNLKSDTKSWIKDKSASLVKASYHLDRDIESILSLGILSKEQKAQLSRLSAERYSIHEHFQLTWKLKSRLKWDLQGDSNTKFFHNFASGRRTQNMIWSLKMVWVMLLWRRVL